jgi:hypothetical protein
MATPVTTFWNVLVIKIARLYERAFLILVYWLMKYCKVKNCFSCPHFEDGGIPNSDFAFCKKNKELITINPKKDYKKQVKKYFREKCNLQEAVSKFRISKAERKNIGESFWYLSAQGYPTTTKESRNIGHDFLFKTGNYFDTLEEAYAFRKLTLYH